MMNRLLSTFYLRVPLYRFSNEGLAQFTDMAIKASFKDDKQQVSKGRSWRIEELRLKSTQDLHKLWYVMLKEKNLLLSDAMYNKKTIGVFGRMGKMSQLRKSMSRLQTVVTEREKVKQSYWKHLEDEYVKQMTEKYYAEKQKQAEENQEIVVPEITPNLLRAKMRDLKRGKDNLNYIEQAIQIQAKKDDFKNYLKNKYDYQNKKIVPSDHPVEDDETVIKQFKSTVHEQIINAVKIPQEEVLRQHVKNWKMLSLRQKRIILGFLNARKARESKKEFLKELDLLGQKIAYDLQQQQKSE